jgi:hypothetical protein
MEMLLKSHTTQLEASLEATLATTGSSVRKLLKTPLID